MTLPRLTTPRRFQSPLLSDIGQAARSSGAYARFLATRKEVAWPNRDGSRKCVPFLRGC
jgi:hypothetical protein